MHANPEQKGCEKVGLLEVFYRLSNFVLLILLLYAALMELPRDVYHRKYPSCCMTVLDCVLLTAFILRLFIRFEKSSNTWGVPVNFVMLGGC